MKHLDRDVRMIADVRVLAEKIQSLHNGVNILRKKYTDQELIKYADRERVKEGSEKLRQVHQWLEVIADALSDTQPDEKPK